MSKRIICLACALFLLAGIPPAFAQRESTAYLFAGDTKIYTNLVERAGRNITTVCPDYFELDADGVAIKTRFVDPAFVAGMQAQGVRVTPFLANHWDMAKARAGLARRAALADQLVAWVREYGFDGIDIDLENINDQDRDNYTDFIRLLKQKMPADKTVSVCVAANPWGWSQGWHGAYDYAALGQIADTVFMMTYDESYQGGDPGPVASYQFIERSIQYGLRYVPKRKLMAGLPFYGRYWKDARAPGGAAFTVSDIENLVSNYTSVTWYDATSECARASLVITQDNVTQGLWGGKKLTAGTYDVWYEDLRSYQKKLGLVGKYDIRGIAAWALGQEPESLWALYPVWLNGLPFTDIQLHWAREHIVRLTELGLVAGKTDKLFAPEALLTRAEAATLLCRLLGLGEEPAVVFPRDIAGHWGEGYLRTLLRRGAMQGYPDGTMRPDKPMTRAELCVMLERVLHVSDALDFNEKRFGDVGPEETAWCNNAIVTLSVEGVLSGYPDGNFYPHQPVTRAEASKIIDILRELPLKTPAPGTSPEAVRFIVEPR